MTKIFMEHPENSRRSKDSKEIVQMIWQYEGQLETCQDELAQKLLTQKINKLKRLIEG